MQQPTQPSAGPAIGARVVALAKSFLGIPYVYGGESPKGFDCSGLVQYVFGQLGISLPRTSEDQFTSGTPITASQAQPGDLVFFGGSGPGYFYDGTPTSPGHVGIVVSPGMMINAPTTGEDVRIQPIVGAVGYRRILGGGADSAAELGAAGAVSGLASGLAGEGTWTSALGTTWNDVSNSLMIWPSTIVGAFGDADAFVGDLVKGYEAFFQPSTYVRIGAGLFGFVFLITGLFFLLREAHA